MGNEKGKILKQHGEIPMDTSDRQTGWVCVNDNRLDVIKGENHGSKGNERTNHQRKVIKESREQCTWYSDYRQKTHPVMTNLHTIYWNIARNQKSLRKRKNFYNFKVYFPPIIPLICLSCNWQTTNSNKHVQNCFLHRFFSVIFVILINIDKVLIEF